MIPGYLLSACPHRQFHTLPCLLDSRAALSNSYPNTLRAKQGGSLYHFYDGFWYEPAGRRTHDLPCERRTPGDKQHKWREHYKPLIPRLHWAMINWITFWIVSWIVIQTYPFTLDIYCSIPQIAHHIIVDCSVIVTSQSTQYLDEYFQDQVLTQDKISLIQIALKIMIQIILLHVNGVLLISN